MENSTVSPSKTSPGQDVLVNFKTSITCTNVPDVLFDASTARKHFSRFGKVLRIRLFPKKLMCIVEYDQPTSVGKAILNAGAFDGFMFEVTRAKPVIRKHSKKEDDPEWLPDSDVEEELSAMSGTPTYRVTRQKKMEVEAQPKTVKPKAKVNAAKFGTRIGKLSPIRKNLAMREKPPVAAQNVLNPVPTIVAPPTSLGTSEAAIELYQLHSRISLSPDEQWRTLDARDRVLRSWGGAGSRVKVGGATIGTCTDMCPEKERLHRQAEHQVMSLESEEGREGELESWRAVKQYSRSSADQEVPMCYELRPAPTLARTCLYLLHEVADTQRQVSLADWFHFMWDRLRGIRKDITQQALCCAESIRLVEMCARFHAHCAARLADLDHTQFDQKLNTDNITKCLQTLKHMYADVQTPEKPRESEFRGYIALLNLGDANFWWEIKQLPIEIQKSEPITFAIKVFNALDNNNYVRFFRLVREKATYLQACILLRYFNDVRARALVRILKAFAPRGGSRYPAEHFMKSLAFETIESMQYFIEHYGLRFSKSDDVEFSIILDRNSFIEDSEPYPISRAMDLIESKRNCSVAEVIAGGPVPRLDYEDLTVYSSFSKDGRLKKSALLAEDQGYNTFNDSNKDVASLKAEVERLLQGRKVSRIIEEPKSSLPVKPQIKASTAFKVYASEINRANESSFIFEPATVVSPNKVTYPPPDKEDLHKSLSFTFSEPKECTDTSIINDSDNVFKIPLSQILLNAKSDSKGRNIFMKPNVNKHISQSRNLFSGTKPSENIFKAAASNQSNAENKHDSKNLFSEVTDKNIFSRNRESAFGTENIFSKPNDENLFVKSINPSGNIFANALSKQKEETSATNIFATANKTKYIFSKLDDNTTKPIFIPNGDNMSDKLRPENVFKNACKPLNGPETKSYSIFKSKNKSLDYIFSAASTESVPVCDNQNIRSQNETETQRHTEKLEEEERRRKEELREKEGKKLELERQEEKQRKEEERKRQEEERRKEELRIKLEQKKAESKRKAEEEERKFKAWVEKEADDVTNKLVDEINKENVEQLVHEEIESYNKLVADASNLTNEILAEVCDEISLLETQAEQFLTHKLMKKWFFIWRKQFLISSKNRRLLDDTPVWIPERTPMEIAPLLRRQVENNALNYMNAFHRGYKFEGELLLPPTPEPYNVMEIVKSALLKRMKEIKYPYDKCLFWKITLVTSGIKKWVYRKIELDKWLLNAFNDKKQHHVSNNLIRVEKQTWNNLMDFAISVSLAHKNCLQNCTEALEGSNGLMFCATEDDNDLPKTIEETISHKYMYQVVPVAIVIPKTLESTLRNDLETLLGCLKNNKVISEYKIFILEPENIANSLDVNAKRALKWIARRYPHSPPLEIDYLKSICQRYLGNEIWYRLKSESDSRIKAALKDISKLIKLYNTAVDKLTDVITNEELFMYPTFPLEFKCYLNDMSPYPKPYEFIPSNVKTQDNVYCIKNLMRQLKLPNPMEKFKPSNTVDMQELMRSYCKQIGWFENPEEVVCKVVSVIPQEFSDERMPCEEFGSFFEQYDLHEFLNVIVYEKIRSLKNFNNCYAIYDKSSLEDFRSFNWLFNTDVVLCMKHKILDDVDDLDMFIAAKRRRIAFNSTEYIPLQDKDCTLVREKIKAVDECISIYSDDTNLKKLEEDMEEYRKKSMEFERALKVALGGV